MFGLTKFREGTQEQVRASACQCKSVEVQSGGGSGRGRGRGSGGADSVHTKEGLQSPVSSLQLALALALAGLRNCL